ncbi:MAG TPA: LarC family nickel insertion protein, partial [Flexilinea sp.]|nr:LarC family nickel insertion protein [Flexilinea sp.]
MKILYCDCYSGISGDMFLAAMLDAGYPLEDLEKVFSLIELPEYQKVSFRKVQKGAISAGQVTFVLREDPHHHTGDLIHGHSHRSFADIRKLITGSNLPESIVAKSLRIFEKIAQAESSVHNVPVDEVHFHEVGATDSILDIVGAAAALDYFGIDQIFSSPLPLGNGEVMTQHGLLPIPAPATAWLLRDMHAKIKPSSVAKELVTPTGAG